MPYALKVNAPNTLNEYNQLDTDKAHDGWITRFLIDPKSGGAKGMRVTEVESSSKSHVLEKWVTLDTLAGPMYLNNMEHAKLVATEWPSRP